MSFAASLSPSWRTDEREDGMNETASRTRISEVGRVIVPVADQDRALEFYLGKLGFEKRADVPYGDGERWAPLGPVPPMFWFRNQDGNTLLIVERS